MIQKETKVYIRCNSGGKIGKVFHIFENNENLGLNIVLGNTVMLSLRKIVPNLKKLKKGDVSRGLVIGAHKKSIFAQSSMHSLKNSVILLQKGENLPLGTRVFTKVSKICRYKGFTRLAFNFKRIFLMCYSKNENYFFEFFSKNYIKDWVFAKRKRSTDTKYEIYPTYTGIIDIRRRFARVTLYKVKIILDYLGVKNSKFVFRSKNASIRTRVKHESFIIKDRKFLCEMRHFFYHCREYKKAAFKSKKNGIVYENLSHYFKSNNIEFHNFDVALNINFSEWRSARIFLSLFRLK